MKRLVLVALFAAAPATAYAADSKTPPADPLAPPAACAAQVFTKANPSCCGTPTFFWDGKACIDATMMPGKCGCTCTGADCGKLFSAKDACEKAYQKCTQPPAPKK
jgi:hypothetical protein